MTTQTDHETTTTNGWTQDDGSKITHLTDGWNRVVFPDGTGYEYLPSGAPEPESRDLTTTTIVALAVARFTGAYERDGVCRGTTISELLAALAPDGNAEVCRIASSLHDPRRGAASLVATEYIPIPGTAWWMCRPVTVHGIGPWSGPVIGPQGMRPIPESHRAVVRI